MNQDDIEELQKLRARAEQKRKYDAARYKAHREAYLQFQTQAQSANTPSPNDGDSTNSNTSP